MMIFKPLLTFLGVGVAAALFVVGAGAMAGFLYVLAAYGFRFTVHFFQS